MPGRRLRQRNFLPLEGMARTVVSLAAVGLIAAGIGYILGLYLTGALTTGTGSPGTGEGPLVIDLPEPETRSEPGTGSDFTGGEDVPGDEDHHEDDGIDPDSQEPVDDAEPEPPSELVTAPSGTQVSVAPVALYVIQIGSFSAADNARQMVSELAQNGLVASAVQLDGHRVWTGMFVDRDSARHVAELVQEAGFEAFVAERRIGNDVLISGANEGLTALEGAIARLPGYLWEAALSWEAASPADSDSTPYTPPQERPLLERLREDRQALARIPDSAVGDSLISVYDQLISLVQSPDEAFNNPASSSMAKASELLAEAEQLFRQLASSADI